MGDIGAFLGLGLCVAVPLAGLGVFVAGAKKRVVIYFDWTDATVSALGVVFLMVLMWAALRVPGEDGLSGLDRQSLLILSGIGVCGVTCVGASLYWSVKHNRSVMVGTLVGLFKLAFVLVVLIGLMSAFSGESRKKGKAKPLTALALIGLLLWVGRATVNGRAVYTAKGWELPTE